MPISAPPRRSEVWEPERGKKSPSPATTRLARAERCFLGVRDPQISPRRDKPAGSVCFFSAVLLVLKPRSGEASSPGAKTVDWGDSTARFACHALSGHPRTVTTYRGRRSLALSCPRLSCMVPSGRKSAAAGTPILGHEARFGPPFHYGERFVASSRESSQSTNQIADEVARPSFARDGVASESTSSLAEVHPGGR